MKKIKSIFALFAVVVVCVSFSFARPPARPHDKPHAPSPAARRHTPPRRDPTRPPLGWYADKHPHMKAWEEHERWDFYEERARLYVEFRNNNVSKILYKQMVELDACREKLANAIANSDDFDIGFYQQKILKIKDGLCRDYEMLVINRGGEVNLTPSEIEEIRRIRAENAKQAE